MRSRSRLLVREGATAADGAAGGGVLVRRLPEHAQCRRERYLERQEIIYEKSEDVMSPSSS
jgi:hypothetical protein